MFGYRIKFRNPFVFARVSYVVELFVGSNPFVESGRFKQTFLLLEEAKSYSAEMIKSYSGMGINAESNVSRYLDDVFDERLFESDCGMRRVFVVNRKVG